MARCPRCSNSDIRGGKTTLVGKGTNGENITVYDYYCPRCGYSESVTSEDANLVDVSRRWEREGAPYDVDVLFMRTGDANLPLEAELDGHRWQIRVNPSHADFTLLIDGAEVQTFTREQWPPRWMHQEPSLPNAF